MVINLLGEVWISIKHYEEIYMVSNFGRVKALQRNRKCSNGVGTRIIRERIMRLCEVGRGYLKVNLHKNNISETRYVHRLVAEAFIENAENKLTVNHKDGDKKNNNSSNLEWATYSENHKHSYRELNRPHSMRGKYGSLHRDAKKIICENTGQVFGSIVDAAHDLGILRTGINSVLSGKYKYTGEGLTFRYYQG